MRRAQRVLLPLGLSVVQRPPSPSSGLVRACAALRVRPAIRARHTRVKTGVGSALCKDERGRAKARNREAARCRQSFYVRQSVLSR